MTKIQQKTCVFVVVMPFDETRNDNVKNQFIHHLKINI